MDQRRSSSGIAAPGIVNPKPVAMKVANSGVFRRALKRALPQRRLLIVLFRTSRPPAGQPLAASPNRDSPPLEPQPTDYTSRCSRGGPGRSLGESRNMDGAAGLCAALQCPRRRKLPAKRRKNLLRVNTVGAGSVETRRSESDKAGIRSRGCRIRNAIVRPVVRPRGRRERRSSARQWHQLRHSRAG